MGFNFPDSPSIGQLHPTPAVVGIPQYQWNGSEWVTPAYNPLNYVLKSGDTMLGALNVVTPPTAAAHAASKAYVDAYATGAAIDALSYSGMQINGSMEVSQMYKTDAVPGIVGGVAYMIDGWAANTSGPQVLTSTQVPLGLSGPSGFSYAISVQVTTANAAPSAPDFCFIYQPIEGYRTRRLAWGSASARPITVSFWVAANRTGNYSGTVNNAPNTRCYPFSFTVNVAGTWEYKTVVIPGDTTGTWDVTNSTGINIIFCMMAGSTYRGPTGAWSSNTYFGATGTINGVAATSDHFLITGVTVLPGSYAPTAAQSPLITRPYGDELVTCMRYLERLESSVYGAGTTPGYNSHMSWFYKVTKRANPSVILASGSVAVLQSVGIDQVNVYATGQSSAFIGGTYADARL